jgi:energy-coupling factor transporter ATP-binding protein EcfA2
MKKNNIITSRLDNLTKLRSYLKNEFIGLNETIDKVVDSITPWYLYKEKMTSNHVVSIWGPTGTGKSQLIDKLICFLKLESAYYDVKSKIEEKNLEKFFDKDVFIFDEFQNASSISSDGRIDRNIKNQKGLFFSLLGESIKLDDYSSATIFSDILILSYHLSIGKIKSKQEYLKNIKIALNNYIEIKEHDFESPKSETFRQIFNIINKNKNLKESGKKIIDLLEKRSDRSVDFRKINAYTANYTDFMFFIEKPTKFKLFFLLGNLDDLTEDIVKSDTSCDKIKESLLSKNNKDVIQVLERLFFPEEISRMGQNHIIFPTLKYEEYKEIINRRINETVDMLKDLNLTLTIDEKVKEFLYTKMIDPVYGARSINSSYKQLFESQVINESIKLSGLGQNKINCVLKEDSFYLNNIKLDSVFFKEDELNPPEIQNQIATHEAGHALIYYLLNNNPPEKIITKLKSSDLGGYVKIPAEKRLESRKILKNKIKVSLAGFLSERMAFGEDEVSAGSFSDLEKATSIASMMIQNFGMGNDLMIFKNDLDSPLSSFKQANDEKIKSILKECESEVEKMLESNKDTLLKLIEKLNTVKQMNSEEFLKIVSKE